MNTARRGSTASNDADNVKEEGVRFNHGSQKHVQRTELSPLRSALKSKSPQRFNYKSEPVRQLHAAVPEVERCITPEFDQVNLGYQSQRPRSFVGGRDGENPNDYRSTFETRGDRRRSIDSYGLDQRQKRGISPHQRSEQVDFPDDVNYIERYEGDIYGNYHRSLGTRRPSSTGRFNATLSSSDSYDQEYYGHQHSGRAFAGSKKLLDRQSRAQEQISTRMHDYQFSQDNVIKKSVFRKEVPTDEQGSLHRNQSLRRRFHSIGRYEFEDGPGIDSFEETKNEVYFSGNPQSKGRYTQPSFEKANRYCEVRRYGETERPRYGPFGNVSQRLDRNGFERCGHDYFGVGEAIFD